MSDSNDYASGYAQAAADTYRLIVRAIQEALPEPHNEASAPTSEFLRMEEMILTVLREVAEGRLSLFDPAQLRDTSFAEEAFMATSDVNERHRRLASAIIEAEE